MGSVWRILSGFAVTRPQLPRTPFVRTYPPGGLGKLYRLIHAIDTLAGRAVLPRVLPAGPRQPYLEIW